MVHDEGSTGENASISVIHPLVSGSATQEKLWHWTQALNQQEAVRVAKPAEDTLRTHIYPEHVSNKWFMNKRENLHNHLTGLEYNAGQKQRLGSWMYAPDATLSTPDLTRLSSAILLGKVSENDPQT